MFIPLPPKTRCSDNESRSDTRERQRLGCDTDSETDRYEASRYGPMIFQNSHTLDEACLLLGAGKQLTRLIWR